MYKLHTAWSYAFALIARGLQNPAFRRAAFKVTLLATRQILNYAASASRNRSEGHRAYAKKYYSG